MKSLLTFQDVSKNYSVVQALDEVSFTIDKGEIFGYIGPNGAGKTTTLKIIVGLIRDFTGQYTINNMKMPENIRELHKFVGYLPQNPAFQEWRTVSHALLTFARLSGLARDSAEQKVNEVLNLLGVEEYRKKKISELSGGTIQKIGLAQALIHNPELLVLDEPLSGLDPLSRKNVKAILKDLSSKGVTVIFSSHILSDVQDIADKIAIINFGNLKTVASLNELEEKFRSSGHINVRLDDSSFKKDMLKDLKYIKDINNSDESLINISLVPGTETSTAIHQIFEKLGDSGCKIMSITPAVPSLDDLYMKYVREDES